VDLDRTFVALADPVRRAVLARLRQGDEAVSALATDHPISLPAFLKHLRVLEDAGLVTTEKVGRVRTCRLCSDGLDAAEDWLRTHREFWNQQLDNLERLFQANRRDTTWPPPSPDTRSKSAAASRPRRRTSTTRGRPPHS
jgi:DNA-binding transcriptional ArsR family regulator